MSSEIYFNLTFPKEFAQDVDDYLSSLSIDVNYDSRDSDSVNDPDMIQLHLDGTSEDISNEALTDRFPIAHIPLDIDWGQEWDTAPGRVHIRFNNEGERITLYVAEESESIAFTQVLAIIKTQPIPAVIKEFEATVAKQTPIKLDKQQVLNASVYRTNRLIGL